MNQWSQLVNDLYSQGNQNEDEAVHGSGEIEKMYILSDVNKMQDEPILNLVLLIDSPLLN